MQVVVYVEGRKAVPVRAVVLTTSGNVTAQSLALELSKPDADRHLTAYQCIQGKAVPVSVDAWDMQREVLDAVAWSFKRQKPQSESQEIELYRRSVWLKSMESLPSGVFVWLDDLEKWYRSICCYSPRVKWREVHRVVEEDDDPEPQYEAIPQGLDLAPIEMNDSQELVLQGFEHHSTTPVTQAVQEGYLSKYVSDGFGAAGVATDQTVGASVPGEAIADRNDRWLDHFETEEKHVPRGACNRSAAHFNVEPSTFRKAVKKAKELRAEKYRAGIKSVPGKSKKPASPFPTATPTKVVMGKRPTR